MKATYRVGIIGSTGRGDYGHELDMAYRDVPEAEVVAVADDNPGGLKQAGDRHRTGNMYADYHGMLEKESLDIVNVCPRFPDQHREMLIATAKSGIKGIFCEKPFAAIVSDADAVIKACEEKNVRVVVAHRRACGAEIHAKELIQQGVIGDIQVFRGHGKSDRRSGGQDLAVLGPHIMDSMRWFAESDVAWVNGHVMQDGRDVELADAREGDECVGLIAGNAITAYFAFKNGLVGHYECLPGLPKDKTGHNMVFGLDIYGTKGIITLRNSPGGQIHLYRDGFWVPGSDYEQWESVPVEGWDNNPDGTQMSNHLIAKDLINSIGENHPPKTASSGHEATEALEMVMAVHESHLEKKRITLPLSNRGNPYGRRQ